MGDVKVKVKVFVVEVEVCPLSRVESCFKNFCPLLPPNGPPWSSLIIGRFSLFEWITRIVAAKNINKSAPVVEAGVRYIVVRTECGLGLWEKTAIIYGHHHQSKKLVK